ncbi:MAG TPA: hypothetical protein VNN07_07600 [Candidatus Tectomicrobia bacterium]|nr:hypothetical protein [Candidatus Tectomicrobia bacterium]
MPDNPEILRERGRGLEEEFFRKEEARLLAKLREGAQRERAREALSRATKITNPAVLDRLIALGVEPQTVTALWLVPLVEVAWADGKLDAGERRAIEDRLTSMGIAPGSVERQLLDSWLTHRPEPKLLTAWTHLVHGLCEALSPEEVATMRQGLLDRARAVAGASGGFMGVGSKISASEAEMLRQLEAAFPAAR